MKPHPGKKGQTYPIMLLFSAERERIRVEKESISGTHFLSLVHFFLSTTPINYTTLQRIQIVRIKVLLI